MRSGWDSAAQEGSPRASGFETAVEGFTSRLVARGIACEVYYRRSSVSEECRECGGRSLGYVQGSRFRRLDTFISSLQAGPKSIRDRNRYSHVIWFNSANLPGILLTRFAGIPTTVNTDGLEWRRSKWSLPFKACHLIAVFLATRISDNVISNARGIQDYYRRQCRRETSFIPYGAEPPANVDSGELREVLREFEIEPGRYFLEVT